MPDIAISFVPEAVAHPCRTAAAAGVAGAHGTSGNTGPNVLWFDMIQIMSNHGAFAVRLAPAARAGHPTNSCRFRAGGTTTVQ